MMILSLTHHSKISSQNNTKSQENTTTMKIAKKLLSIILLITPSAHPFSSFHPSAQRRISTVVMSAVTAASEEEYNINIEAIAAKYGLPGSTDPEGFDPYADTVGPGIYGGSVKRDENGEIVIGEQYQNHNHRPGPAYDGKGYSLMSRAIHMGEAKVREVLKGHPYLKDEISTGGARPLHVCGMSKKGQLATQAVVNAGADINALDTYNYNALHRMASNDLHIGGEVLVKAGMDPNYKPPEADSTPIDIARRSRAINFLMTMQKLGHYD